MKVRKKNKAKKLQVIFPKFYKYKRNKSYKKKIIKWFYKYRTKTAIK